MNLNSNVENKFVFVFVLVFQAVQTPIITQPCLLYDVTNGVFVVEAFLTTLLVPVYSVLHNYVTSKLVCAVC